MPRVKDGPPPPRSPPFRPGRRPWPGGRAGSRAGRRRSPPGERPGQYRPPRGQDRASSSATARQISRPMRQAASTVGAAKNTSSPMVLTTRPPPSTAAVQAADSKRARARLWSRSGIDWPQAVDPTRSTKPRATTSVGPSSVPAAGGLEACQDRAASARRSARSKAFSTRTREDVGHRREGGRGGLGQLRPRQLVGTLAVPCRVRARPGRGRWPPRRHCWRRRRAPV